MDKMKSIKTPYISATDESTPEKIESVTIPHP